MKDKLSGLMFFSISNGFAPAMFHTLMNSAGYKTYVSPSLYIAAIYILLK